MLANGEKASAPYDAGEGFTWTVNGLAYDFATEVNGDITIAATKPNGYEVKVLSTGAITSQETVTVGEGVALDFSAFEKSGYDFVVVTEEGKVITELTVVEATTINVIYTKR